MKHNGARLNIIPSTAFRIATSSINFPASFQAIMETPDDRRPSMQSVKEPAMRQPLMTLTVLALGFLLASPALAQPVSREQDVGELRLGQRIKVDDGTCPAGQIKEISGTRMTSGGIVRSQKCIPRLGPKQR
jgi:hypothetical protein